EVLVRFSRELARYTGCSIIDFVHVARLVFRRCPTWNFCRRSGTCSNYGNGPGKSFDKKYHQGDKTESLRQVRDQNNKGLINSIQVYSFRVCVFSSCNLCNIITTVRRNSHSTDSSGSSFWFVYQVTDKDTSDNRTCRRNIIWHTHDGICKQFRSFGIISYQDNVGAIIHRSNIACIQSCNSIWWKCNTEKNEFKKTSGIIIKI